MTRASIERRLEYIERRPQPRPFNPTERRDPREMTSLDIAQRIEELRAKARWLTAERITSGAPAPALSQETIRISGRLGELRARAVVLAGRPLPRRVLPVTGELEADDE
jgi:hypothetical protein